MSILKSDPICSLAEKTGGFSSSFFMAAAFAGLAIALISFLKKPHQT